MNILILENLIDKKNLTILKKNHNIFYNKNKKKNKIETIFTRLKYNLNQDFLSNYPNLKYVISPTTGTNHIDNNYIKKNGIKFINLLGQKKKIRNVSSTSQFNFALIISASRKLLDYNFLSKKNIFNRYKYETFQFEQLTCGIIGYGRIGKYLCKNLAKLGFKILIYEKYLKKKIFKKKNISFVSLNKLMEASDIISLNVNNQKNNTDFINKKNLNKCKKKPIFINTSRGEYVNEKDLIDSINKGNIFSAYIDVVKNEQEKELINKNLYKMSNRGKIHIFPHIGGTTKKALIYTEKLVINKFIKFKK